MTMTTEPELSQVRVGDAMRSGVLTCPPETTLRAVARMMTTYRVHAIVVTAVDAEGESEDAVNAITALDLTSVARQPDFPELAARDAATTALPAVAADDTLAEAAQVMSQQRLEHLIVVDSGTGNPVGFLSTLDVARALAGQ